MDSIIRGEKVMLSGKARAHTNIALIKYWGKANEEYILPMNSSLSLTLDAFYTETTVTFDAHYSEDVFILDGILQNEKQTKKVKEFLNLVRQQADCTWFAKVESQNFVPTAAGLASSASGLAALAGACNVALGLNLSAKDLSRLARRGSGSACRSIFGGFAQWNKGHSDETSFAENIPANNWENELAMLFILINDGEKDVSSRDGMKRTVETSSFYQGWLDNVEKDLSQVHEAIKTKDFPRLGEIIEANGLRMHRTTLGAVPPFTYWSPGSLQAMALVRQARAKGIPCYFTMDAGPNVKVLVEKKNLEALKTFLSEHFSKEQLVPAFAGPGIELFETKGMDK